MWGWNTALRMRFAIRGWKNHSQAPDVHWLHSNGVHLSKQRNAEWHLEMDTTNFPYLLYVTNWILVTLQCLYWMERSSLLFVDIQDRAVCWQRKMPTSQCSGIALRPVWADFIALFIVSISIINPCESDFWLGVRVCKVQFLAVPGPLHARVPITLEHSRRNEAADIFRRFQSISEWSCQQHDSPCRHEGKTLLQNFDQ